MKVLQLTTHLNIGGIANYIATLSMALKERGVECIVVSAGGDLEDELERQGIVHKKINIRTKSELSPKILMSIFAVKKIVEKEKIDIIHAHTRVSQVVAYFVRFLTGVPYITTCHGFFKTRFRKIFDTWGAKVIAISDSVKNHLNKDLAVSEDRIELIYSGVDIKKYSKRYSDEELNEIRKNLGLKEGMIIGTIGRLSPVKGQKFLIEAMTDVTAMLEDVHCIIIGDGPERAELKDLAGSLSLSDSVHFFSSDPDTHKFLSVMDVFVFPSLKEGLGIALLEALASGKACVASDVGGIGDIITDSVTGMLVPAGNPNMLAKTVLGLLEDEGLRKKMGERGSKLVKEKFSLGSMADRVLNVYREVLGT